MVLALSALTRNIPGVSAKVTICDPLIHLFDCARLLRFSRSLKFSSEMGYT